MNISLVVLIFDCILVLIVGNPLLAYGVITVDNSITNAITSSIDTFRIDIKSFAMKEVTCQAKLSMLTVNR